MSKYNQHYSILSAIRRCFSRSPTHREVLQAAKTKEKGPKGGARYKCSICGESFGQKEVHVDHINPVVPLDRKGTDMTWDEIVNNIFCSLENLQAICVTCHKAKSKEERANAKTTKRLEEQSDKSSGRVRRSRKK